MSIAMNPHCVQKKRTLKVSARFSLGFQSVRLTRSHTYNVEEMQKDVFVTEWYATRNEEAYIQRAHRAVHKTFGPEVADESACGGYYDARQHLILKEAGAMLESKFLSFLCKAAIRRAIKIIRPVQKRGGGHLPSLSLDVACDTEGTLANTLVAPNHPWMVPDWIVIRDRVNALDPSDREIVHMRAAGSSFKEIAVAIGRSEEEVRHRYYYVVKRIMAKDRGEK